MSSAASSTTTPQSVKVIVFPAGTKLSCQSGDSSHSNQSVTWDETEYELQAANLVLDASQSAELGADCWVGMNGVQTNLAANWAAGSTNKQTQSLVVTEMLNNGSNDFWLHYDATQIPFTSTEITFDLTLQIVLKYIGTGTPSKTPISTSQGVTLPDLPWYAWVAIAAGIVILIVAILLMRRHKAS